MNFPVHKSFGAIHHIVELLCGLKRTCCCKLVGFAGFDTGAKPQTTRWGKSTRKREQPGPAAVEISHPMPSLAKNSRRPSPSFGPPQRGASVRQAWIVLRHLLFSDHLVLAMKIKRLDRNQAGLAAI